MKTIWKWTLTQPRTEACLPAGAQPLAVQMQDGWPTVWALVDIEAPAANYMLTLYATGEELPDGPGRYVGTVQDRGFVWHLFMETL